MYGPSGPYGVPTGPPGPRWDPTAAPRTAGGTPATTQRIPFTTPRPVRYLRLTFAATAVPAQKLAIADVGAFTR